MMKKIDCKQCDWREAVRKYRIAGHGERRRALMELRRAFNDALREK